MARETLSPSQTAHPGIYRAMNEFLGSSVQVFFSNNRLGVSVGIGREDPTKPLITLALIELGEEGDGRIVIAKIGQEDLLPETLARKVLDTTPLNETPRGIMMSSLKRLGELMRERDTQIDRG